MDCGRNEERVVGLREERGHPYYKVTKNLAGLCSCSSVLWKAGLGSDEIGYLAETIFNSFGIDSIDWLRLTAYSKM